MSEPSPLLLERDAGVAILTFNDPERRNAMTQAMGEAVAECVADLAADRELRAVVLTGAGRAFSAGGDLGMIGSRAREGTQRPGVARRGIRDTMRSFYKLFLSVRDLPCPTIAAVNGAAIGAGLCVALACDVRVASAEAKLGLNFTVLGLHPGMGATWTLPRLVGPALAAEILFSGRVFRGEEAARMGLVNRVVAPDAVLPTARELAAEFAASAPLAVRAVKRALARSPYVSLEDQLSFEAEEQAACFETQDVREGLAAAKERRPPRFQGR
ncbi:MAG: enoyl-CoA hydratase/isomerase family protein [Myxococcales bacterium]|nr:enoyl-CoA hydratase/isomerase family protein [Myxococcales bacterium]